MNASQLIAGVRKSGRVWLDELGRLNAEGASETQMAELADSHDLVVGLLREEIASARWGNSGKNPKWWCVPEQAWTYPEQTLKPISELVRIWATEKCLGSKRCATKARALHREYLSWLGLGEGAATEKEFVQQLEVLGWPSVDGWVDNIALAEDFVAALQNENHHHRCPDEDESQDRVALGAETPGHREKEQESEREALTGRRAV